MIQKLLFFLCITVCVIPAIVLAEPLIGGDQGWIEVRCNINGASVSFNGEYKCTIQAGSCTVPVYTTATPYTAFTVEKAGYYPYQGQLFMPGTGETRTVYATLNPIPTQTPVPPPDYGSITVDSSPSGAAVYLNGNYRGVAPVSITQVRSGSYSVECDLVNYQPYSTTTTVSMGTTSYVNCPLQKIVSPGSLYIVSDPAGAVTYLDGTYKGKTPLSLSNIAPTTHTVEFDLSGFYDWKSTVTVPAGGTRTVSATLAPIPASTTGWISVTSVPAGATVFLDGTAAGQTAGNGVLKINNVRSGDHTLRVEMVGYQPYSATVTVQVSTVSDVLATLVPIPGPATTGTVSVTSTPSGANVFIDNVLRGVTPLTLADIPAGSHLILLRLDGYNDYTTTQQVNAGATNTITAALNPSVTPLPTRSGTGLLGVLGALALIGLYAYRRGK
jgi:hypothetical protein